jgi:hypothetical protein
MLRIELLSLSFQRRTSMKTLPMLAAVLTMGFAMEASADDDPTATDWFKISQISVSGANNMHFRVSGMGAMSEEKCTSPYNTWAFVDGADSGAQGKMSVLMAAWLAGKEVRVVYAPVDYYGDRKKFCRIHEFTVR